MGDALDRWLDRSAPALRRAWAGGVLPRVWVVAPALAVAGAGASLAAPPRPRLVWNASASAPPGLYLVRSPSAVRRGDMVVAWTPRSARRLAARRHYLPANVPLVKRIAALAGDHVCAEGALVSVNGRVAALRRAADARGRPMPGWSGCRVLAPGDYLLLMESPDSFDGRYFGITRSRDLVGRARLLWAR